MRVTADIAYAHARALAHNFKAGNPNAHRDIMADYVAENMAAFIAEHDNVDGVADERPAWYAHAIVNFGA